MKVWLKAGVIIFYVLGYCFLRKRMRRDVFVFCNRKKGFYKSSAV